ncbi:hypothetical protein P171DRAFT_434703 [Karstenula rhodostoma CBS 690.94]|uniref:Uncharacterized protein n=1 Tax=Karstenula rhodostoma CBS 690.94 TaxID=1392251 RepID=A0A9P4U9F5_9PLEO|nr:hypothetical protein P171DRAFT_434703 [Karstenula rhodostoma CBS 690.94]
MVKMRMTSYPAPTTAISNIPSHPVYSAQPRRRALVDFLQALLSTSKKEPLQPSPRNPKNTRTNTLRERTRQSIPPYISSLSYT